MRGLLVALVLLSGCRPAPREWTLHGQRVKALVPRGWTEHLNQAGEPTLALTDRPTPWVSLHLDSDAAPTPAERVANVARDQLAGVEPTARADGKFELFSEDPDGKRSGWLLMPGAGNQVLMCAWSFIDAGAHEAQARSFCDSVELLIAP